MSSARRVVAYAALFLLPWSLVFVDSQLTLVFPFGLVNFGPLYLVDVVSYATVNTDALPRFLLGWPIGVGLYVLALASAVSGLVFDREDRRVTALLIVVAGLTQVSLALGLSRWLGTTAVPVGAALCWAAVWWFDWPAVRTSLAFSRS
jgi:uncharacterized protein (TIGR04206 family)